MARHVFQYEKMDSELGMYFGDPAALPPLRPTEEQQAAAGSNGTGWDLAALMCLVRSLQWRTACSVCCA
jgi:hypothetical protein